MDIRGPADSPKGRQMTLERIRAVHRALPFQPFTIRVADGRSFHVTHPELLSISPSGRTIVVNYGVEDFSVIDLLLVTEIQVTPSSPASA
jgi:hypothetical protein